MLRGLSLKVLILQGIGVQGFPLGPMFFLARNSLRDGVELVGVLGLWGKWLDRWGLMGGLACGGLDMLQLTSGAWMLRTHIPAAREMGHPVLRCPDDGVLLEMRGASYPQPAGWPGTPFPGFARKDKSVAGLNDRQSTPPAPPPNHTSPLQTGESPPPTTHASTSARSRPSPP